VFPEIAGSLLEIQRLAAEPEGGDCGARSAGHLYQRTTLENGLRVLTETVPGSRAIAMGILVQCGSRDETPEEAGLAHLCEHLVFQGTSTRSALEIARRMDGIGGQVGAFTTKDYTCYYASVLDDYCFHALDLLSDLLLHSTFPPEALERERRAILREIDGDWDAPERRLQQALKQAVWPDHPLGRPVAGRPETLERCSREDIIYFLHRHYMPNRIIVAAAGGVEHDSFTVQVRDCFWRMLGASDATLKRAPQYLAAEVFEEGPLRQAYFCLALPAHAYAHPERYALHLMNRILGGGISSRLFRRLREEEGLVYQIGSEYQAFRDSGLWVIEGSAAPEHLERVIELIVEELWALAEWTRPVDEEELWLAKVQIRSMHLLGSEDPHTVMSRLATQELYFKRPIPPEKILESIDAVDTTALRRVAETLGLWLPQIGVACLTPPMAESARLGWRKVIKRFRARADKLGP